MTTHAQDDDSGILAQVPGEYVAAALRALPDDFSQRFRATTIDVPFLGLTRFTCQRHVTRKGKFVSNFWVAIKAEATT